MALARSNVTTSPTPIYVSVGSTAITNAYFCNVTGTSVTINIHLVSAGTEGDNTNLIYKSLVIPAYNTFVMDTEKIVLDNGDSIQVSASNSPAIVATVTYLSI